MKTRGLTFTADSILALLTCAQCGVLSPGVCPKCGSAEKLKSMTRRVSKIQPVPWRDGLWQWNEGDVICHGPLEGLLANAPHKPGDIVWAKEPWRTERRYDELPPRDLPHDAAIEYLADTSCDTASYVRMRRVERLVAGRTRSGLFLSQRFARIRREVVAVRAERLQDITEEDAIAEGVKPWRPKHEPLRSIDAQVRARHGWSPEGSYINGFRELWGALHAKRHGGAHVWHKNPVVFVYTLAVSSREGAEGANEA